MLGVRNEHAVCCGEVWGAAGSGVVQLEKQGQAEKGGCRWIWQQVRMQSATVLLELGDLCSALAGAHLGGFRYLQCSGWSLYCRSWCRCRSCTRLLDGGGMYGIDDDIPT